MKHIGVLTSGGDAPGMNAAIRSVVRTARKRGVQVTGIAHGYNGLIHSEFCDLDSRSVARIIERGGTMLKSSRSEAFYAEEGRTKAAQNISARGIDGLIIIGGDGSMRGAQALSAEHNVPFLGLPGTIDNDLVGTDFTIGFDTAVQTTVECVDKIRDTASSHDRLFLVEVMGRDTGHIALHTAIACGASAVLMPENPLSVEQLCQRLEYVRLRGKNANIVVVAEGNPTGDAAEVASSLEQITRDYETRVTVLGHLQRGGSPTAVERVRATLMGAYAANQLIDGRSDAMAGIIDGMPKLTPIEEVVSDRAHASLTDLEQLLEGLV